MYQLEVDDDENKKGKHHSNHKSDEESTINESSTAWDSMVRDMCSTGSIFSSYRYREYDDDTLQASSTNDNDSKTTIRIEFDGGSSSCDFYDQDESESYESDDDSNCRNALSVFNEFLHSVNSRSNTMKSTLPSQSFNRLELTRASENKKKSYDESEGMMAEPNDTMHDAVPLLKDSLQTAPNCTIDDNKNIPLVPPESTVQDSITETTGDGETTTQVQPIDDHIQTHTNDITFENEHNILASNDSKESNEFESLKVSQDISQDSMSCVAVQCKVDQDRKSDAVPEVDIINHHGVTTDSVGSVINMACGSVETTDQQSTDENINDDNDDNDNNDCASRDFDMISLSSHLPDLDDLIMEGEKRQMSSSFNDVDKNIDTNSSFESAQETALETVPQTAVHDIVSNKPHQQKHDVEDTEHQKKQTYELADILKSWGKNVKHSVEMSPNSRRSFSRQISKRDHLIETGTNSRHLNSSSHSSTFTDLKLPMYQKGEKTVAFSLNGLPDTKDSLLSSKRKKSKKKIQVSSLTETQLTTGVKFVKVRRKRLPASHPKLLGGLALVENNETMKYLSQIEYSRKLWVDMQMNATRREWDQYKNSLKVIIEDSEKIVDLIQSSFSAFERYGHSIDLICRDVYVGSNGQALSNIERNQLTENGYVSNALRTSSILKPIVTALNQLKDELDHYVPLMEISCIEMKTIRDEVKAKVDLFEAHGDKLVEFQSILEAEDKVSNAFGQIVMSVGSFGTNDSTQQPAEGQHNTYRDRWLNEAMYRNATRMGRLEWIRNRQELQDLFTEIIDFDDKRRERLKDILLVFKSRKEKLFRGARGALSLTTMFNIENLNSKENEFKDAMALDEFLNQLTSSKVDCKQVGTTDVHQLNELSKSSPESCVPVHGKALTDLEKLNSFLNDVDLFDSPHVDQKKNVEVLVDSHWKHAIGILTRDYYLHIFFMGTITDSNDEHKNDAKAKLQIKTSPSPDISVNLALFELTKFHDLIEHPGNGSSDPGKVDQRTLTFISKRTIQNTGLFSKLRKKNKTTELQKGSNTELTIRFQTDNEASMFANSVTSITTSSA